MSQFIDVAQVGDAGYRKRLGLRLLFIPSLCGLVLLRLERLLPPRKVALLRLVEHLKHQQVLRDRPVVGQLLLRAMITPLGVGRRKHFSAK